METDQLGYRMQWKEEVEVCMAEVAKWIKEVDYEFTTRGFNPHHSPISKLAFCFEDILQP